MSRIGKLPITLPKGVEVNVSDKNVVTVKGAKGTLTQKMDAAVTLKNTDGKLTFNENKKREDDLFVVKKVKISDIKSIEDFEKIVIDPNLGYYLKKVIEERMKNEALSFEKALLKPIYAFGKDKDKNGKQIQPIRHIRTKARGRGGLIVNPPEIKNIEKAFESKRIHKRKTYAGNGEIPICAFYEWSVEGKRERELKPYSILEISSLYHFEKNTEIVESEILVSKGKGKKKIDFAKKLVAVLKKNQHVIFFKENIDELKELYSTDIKSFTKRIYSIIKFDDSRITFQHHLCSLSNEDIIKEMSTREMPSEGASYINWENPFLKLRLSQGALNMAIEEKDFDIKLDGQINWKF